MEWSEELTGGLLHAVPDAILVLDGTRIVLANDRAEELSGYPRAELIGRPVETLFDEARTVVRRRDGREVPAESSEAVVETPDGQRTVAVIRALSDVRRTCSAAGGWKASDSWPAASRTTSTTCSA